MSALGSIAVYLALGAALWAAGVGFYGARTKNAMAIRSAEGAIKATAVCLTTGALALWWALITHDFTIQYVAEVSSRALPLFYTIGALWAGQAGSILLWAWILSIYSTIVVIKNKNKNRDLMPYVVVVLGAVIGLFTFLIAFTHTSPFSKLPAGMVPLDGQGMNPLLQNYSQMFHPVTIYTGFVGFTIPFAFCIAALATGRLDDRWIKTVRGWTIWAWLFLGIGVILGARWAYVELGWGGYWGWDPVENSSLMPWLIGTAFLHSVMIQEKKGMLKVWNVTLAVAAFVLSLFGTFLTRSGVVQSVHAFAESSVGPFLITGIAVVVAVSGALIVYRLPELRSKAVMESIASREGAFLLNNLILVALAFMVFWGTTYPIVAKAIGRDVTVSGKYFNYYAPTLGAALVLLTGFCPLLAWRKASKKNLKRNFVAPLSGGLIVGAVLYVMAGGHHTGAVLMGAFSAFVFVTIFSEFYRGARARVRIKKEKPLKAMGKLFTTNPRRYAGYVIHLGTIILILGMAINTAYKTDSRTTLDKGASYAVKGYKITFTGVETSSTALKDSTTATVRVESLDGKFLGNVRSTKAFYQNTEQPTTEVGILPSVAEDLYIILEAPMPGDTNTNTASLRFVINPGMFWIWLGAILMVGGGVASAMFGRKKEVTRETALVYANVDA